MKLDKKLVAVVFLIVSSLCCFYWSPPALSSSNARNAISDSAITVSIKTKMAKDHDVSATSINVETNDGKVTLAGTAKTETEAMKAIEIAESVEGAKNVDASSLVIEGSNQPLTDAIITAKIKGLFVREKVFGKQPISVTGITVETNNGVVTLSGRVKNRSQENTAVRLARSIEGVRKVSSNLEIKS